MTGFSTPAHLDPAYRRALRLGAALNLAMLFIEGGIGFAVGSAALLADAADFLEDASIYGLAVVAIGWSPRWRGWAAGAQGFAMAGVGVAALAQIVRRLFEGGAPPSSAIAATALLALAVNVFCAWQLARFRGGDASMRSIWLSTRNDAILNALTIFAAALIAATGSGWPDIAAGALIAAINLWAAAEVLWKARRELAAAAQVGAG
ncbi:MAG: cation transporter [Methylocella sp.]